MNILIATPCYGGMIHTQCAQSIMELRILFSSKNIRHEWLPIMGESLIPRARNASIAYFLCKDFTHILFVDSDIVFDPVSVLRLVDKDVPISACVYPYKDINIDNIVNKARSTSIDTTAILLSSMSYVMNTNDSVLDDGWLKVSEVGTGFLLIRKDLISKLVDLHPSLKYKNDCPYYDRLHQSMNDNFYLFFDTRVVDDRYLSEDYSFCHYVTDAGYDIYVDTTSGINHIGTYTYRGNLYMSMLYK